jgi:hypothetical protein
LSVIARAEDVHTILAADAPEHALASLERAGIRVQRV